MLMTPMVHFERGAVHRHVLDALFQFVVIDDAEGVEVLIVDAQGQHEVPPFPARHSLAPRHLVPGFQRNFGIGLPELAGIVNTVGQRHSRIKEFQGILHFLTLSRRAAHKRKKPHKEGFLQSDS